MSLTLAALSVESFAVSLEWSDTTGGADHYYVKRNGTIIATLANDATTYDDTGIFPQTAYAYQIEGVTGSPYFSNTVDVTTPISPWNCDCETTSTYRTLAQLRTAMLYRLGYAQQAANPPAGMTGLLNEFLQDAQRQLYVGHSEIRTRRFYKWTMVPGQRYYGILDNDNDDTADCFKQLDKYTPYVEWVGFEDLNLAWYPLTKGIDPVLYTRAQITLGYPSNYEIRGCIEIFPAPRAAYTLWVKGDFGLDAFTADDDRTTIDDQAVFLLALGNAKAHYKQADGGQILTQAGNYVANLVARSHQTARYVPRTTIERPLTPPRFLPLEQQ